MVFTLLRRSWEHTKTVYGSLIYSSRAFIRYEDNLCALSSLRLYFCLRKNPLLGTEGSKLPPQSPYLKHFELIVLKTPLCVSRQSPIQKCFLAIIQKILGAHQNALRFLNLLIESFHLIYG